MGEPLSPNTSASISAVEREWESRLMDPEPSEELQQFRTPGFGLPPRALSSLGGHRASAQRSQVLPALDAEAGSPMGLARAGSNMKKKRLSPMEKPLPPDWQSPSPIERPLDGKSERAAKGELPRPRYGGRRQSTVYAETRLYRLRACFYKVRRAERLETGVA
ncbi:hypothetical protein PPROV_000824400 [Pycnococcus provasolii]|uniref:Uncharacterized protein n=1 Tax=Pycnococcus provasolii TaxID=41880 RepID=A0A830HX79_9CHLO|nr:hypothetical protein PPROV_000824400 [Pycnococcus provasolii]